jgi:hypothetical protein
MTNVDALLDPAFRLPMPDRSPIYTWARKHIILPESYAIPGPFNVGLSPWLIPVFDALQDDSVRVVTVSKSVQSAGTLIADIWVPWLIANQPGPIAWTMHTDDMVQRHAKTRLNPVLDRCKPVADLLPKAGPLRTITEIYFGGFFLILNSANMSDQQSQSIRFKVQDEIWHPKWQPIYKYSLSRVTMFEQMGTSKILNISQGGWENDVSDEAWRAGHMAEWSANCFGCGKSMPLDFGDQPEKAAKSVGVVWADDAKKDDGSWDVARVMETTRFRCVHCGHEHDDSDRTRERWRRDGHYVTTRPDAPAVNRSFHFEAVAGRQMKLLAQQFCEAENTFARTGSDELRQNFHQQRRARAWKVETPKVEVVGSSDHTMKDYWNGEKVPSEAHRFMTVDRQQKGWWVEVGAWTATPEYWHLYFGHVETIDQLRAVQQRYGVPDSCVAQDRRYLPSQVDAECIRYGWRGMMGHKRKTWTMRNTETGELENFPYSDPRISSTGDGQAIFYEFSGSHCKDIVASAIGGKAFRWRLPKDVSPLYLEHLKAEEKREKSPGVWEWVEVIQDRNHGFDTSAMMVSVATIVGLVKFNAKADA